MSRIPFALERHMGWPMFPGRVKGPMAGKTLGAIVDLTLLKL